MMVCRVFITQQEIIIVFPNQAVALAQPKDLEKDTLFKEVEKISVINKRTGYRLFWRIS